MSLISVHSSSARLTSQDLQRCKKRLEGFSDIHLHLAPDTVKRICDDYEFAEDAEKLGYRAFILKDHFAPTAGRAYDLGRLFPKLAIFGGITLNHYVGGLNPDAVETAIILGAKEVWLPTFGAINHFQHFGAFGLPGYVPLRQVKRSNSSKKGISILAEDSTLRPEVDEILGMIADSNIILGTGHIGLKEIYVLAGSARKAGVKKLLVTHPEFSATNWPAEDQMKLVEKGAIMEHCANLNYDAKLYAKNIKQVGASHCVLSSDSGQLRKGHPALAMTKFIEDLMEEGVTESEIETMAKSNTKRLLDLD